ncbi:MAG: hypothetical protein ABWZ25_05205 [Chitinophagaceae bacterium]
MMFLLYIDPGSGSYLVQVIVAAVLGVAVFFRNIKLYIRTLFFRPRKKPKPNQTAENNDILEG